MRYGGIAGLTYSNTSSTFITNCYNVGDIKNINQGAVSSDCVGGIVGGIYTNSGSMVSNSYNIGNVSALRAIKKGEIIGQYYKNINNRQVNNWIKTQNFTALNLGDAFTNDVQNPDGTWKYNNGYPILKWQLEE